MHGDKIMKTLLSLLNEEKENLPGSVLNEPIVALMSGRPSEEVKNLRGRAESDPTGLLKSVGITSFPNEGNKIKNLEKIFNNMISAKNVSADHPAQYFKNFFQVPEIVKSPNKTAPGLLIKLTGEAKSAVGQSGSAKKSLRIFAFWFASVVQAISNSNSNYFDIDFNRFKFQFATGQQAMLIFVSSGKSWKNL